MHRSAASVAAVLILAAMSTPPFSNVAEQPVGEPVLGACYLIFDDRWECAGETTETACRERCDEMLCDKYYWLDRRACWNWGYGG